MSLSVWRGALLLTVAAVAVKVMSAAYRIPYQNIAGDLGFYVYQQIYPFFAVAMFLATYGFPAAISKLVAARFADGDESGAAGVFVRSLFVLALFSSAVFLVVYTGASWISTLMGDENLVKPLRTVAFCFLFVPPVAAIRGFFQGAGRMQPTAVSQLIEQFIRAALIIGLTFYVAFSGFGPYAAGTAAGFGSLAGMAAATIILILFIIRYRGKLGRQGKGIALGSLVKMLSYEGLAFSASSLILVFFLMIDTFTVVPLLGTSLARARILMGIYDRGYPLVQLVTAAAMSFSLAFVPAMARAKATADWAFIREKSEWAARLCVAFGIAAAVGFALIASPVNVMLFEDASGSAVLAGFGLTMMFGMVAMTTAGILQAMGKTRQTLCHTGTGLLVKLALNVWLIPVFGLFGAAAATIVPFAMIAVLNGFVLHRQTGAFSFLWRSGRKALTALVFMAITVALWRFGMSAVFSAEGNERWVATITSLGGAGFGGGIYLLTLIRLGFFSKSELKPLTSTGRDSRSA
ncbi:MAG TPA: polysaccharide biosynthesis protein [Bacillales bacterium]|nr:polysaccharide biosynthesis protein [Bacillales bacterium]